jgi:hypothetical protein
VLDRDKVPRHCRVTWRAADRIGVAFDKNANRPLT